MGKIFKRTAMAVAAAMVVVLIGALAWCSQSLEPDMRAQSCLQSPDQAVFTPQGKSATADYEYGLVFYPGAKVSPQAYAPLLQTLADQGWLCVTVDAPFHLALANQNAAASVLASYPQVKNWYVGGHSMGGVAACGYAADHEDQLAGIILLASYSASDVDASNLDVVFVYGTNDTVLSIDKTENSVQAFGARARSLVIQGGNHAQFGDYGDQDGDSPASISPAEQQQQTVAFITQGGFAA